MVCNMRNLDLFIFSLKNSVQTACALHVHVHVQLRTNVLIGVNISESAHIEKLNEEKLSASVTLCVARKTRQMR